MRESLSSEFPKQVENLYRKLYDKYSELKRNKESEIDQSAHDQEVRFLQYSSAAEELIDYMKNDNCRLQSQINDLTKEVSSTRYAMEEQLLEYEQLLNEEKQKTKKLSEELERVRQQEQLFCSTMDGKDGQLDSPGGTYIRTRDMPNESSRKRPFLKRVAIQTDEARAYQYKSGQMEHDMGTEMEGNSCRYRLSDRDGNIQQTGPLPSEDEVKNKRELSDIGNCCGSNNSGFDGNCMFQTLVECLVGMKFNLSSTKGGCLSALHQSSGYSFSLTWVSKAVAAGEEVLTELLYHVTSLGTFERVAPEWMKEDLMFSTSMCPVFFKRLSRVIGLNL